MSSREMLKVMINRRLSEAAEEIFALFEQSVSEYQREIDRLKKEATESNEKLHTFLVPKLSPEGDQQTQTVSQDTDLNWENTGPFYCKEEMEQVMITEEEKPQMMITNIQSLNNKDEVPQEEQASGGAEIDNRSESNSESEENDSVTDSNEEAFVYDAPKKPLSCSFCKKRFTQKRGLKMHMRKFHPGEPYDALQDNEQHSEMGSAEARSFSCTVCERRFKSMYSLQAHMRKHDGETLFRCTECSVAFGKEAKFFRHMKTVHSIEKPFKCAVCGKCLKTAHAHRTHMLIHTGERPFKCSVCGKGFVQKVSLKNHMVTHTGEKPFCCTDCGKNYSTSQSLMIHTRLIHH